jgi:hypothetical protein
MAEEAKVKKVEELLEKGNKPISLFLQAYKDGI